MIQLSNVSKEYRKNESLSVNALQDVSLEIKPGELVAIVGPSGSGKSTAVNMIGCLDIPSKGDIYLDGQNIANLSESDLSNLNSSELEDIYQDQREILNEIQSLKNFIQ